MWTTLPPFVVDFGTTTEVAAREIGIRWPRDAELAARAAKLFESIVCAIRAADDAEFRFCCMVFGKNAEPPPPFTDDGNPMLLLLFAAVVMDEETSETGSRP
jgi:uncharacterized protein YbjT (DUF2867 family)